MIPFYWMLPQRERYTEYQSYVDQWQPYRTSAAKVGFELTVIDADDVAVWHTEAETNVYVRGKQCYRDAAAFHTKLLTWPNYNVDVWRFLSTFAVLEASGFYTTIPPMQSVVNDDKLLTFLQPWAHKIPRLPTLRILTRNFVNLESLLDPAAITFPVLVKPSNWGSGMGVVRANSLAELTAVLQIAGASELVMLIQPLLGDQPVDCRVYCIEGEPDLALARKPLGAALTSNVELGGQAKLIAPPEALTDSARTVAAALGAPYVAVDFLMSAEGTYLSEIEVDGMIPVTVYPEMEGMLDRRFAAYRRRFDRFCEHLGG
jgi:glutathione synthase/RimK-type ligase-like ATP-grasp enzyme